MFMSGAIAAYSDAFSSYKKSVLDCSIYSITTVAVGSVLAAFLLATAVVLGIFSIGGVVNTILSGKGFSVELLGMALTSFVVAIGLLIFLLVQGGLSASYLETLYILHSGRKQSMAGLFFRIPRYAVRMLLLTIIIGVVLSAPIAAGLLISNMVGWGLAGIAVTTALVLFSMFLSIFFIFAMPAMVADDRGPLDAVKISIVHAIKHFIQVAIFVVLSSVIALPALIPFLGAIYLVVFYLPLSQTALLVLYKHSH